jgi:S1-C subfamily serine protease
MKYLKPAILALLIAVLSSFLTLQTRICYSDNPSSTIVDNLYSSVVLITHKKLKTSVWDTLRFAAFVAGQVAGTGSFGVGSYKPVHTEKTIGTGFQTKWGVITNSHVMDDKTKAVLTTFHSSSYRIKKINRIKCKNKHIPMHNAKLIQGTSKEATIYDWGDMDIDLALIQVKIPGAFSLPLAKEVKIDEQVVSLGHPKSKKFTPAIGRVNRIYKRRGTKYIELFIKNAPGSSGSPVLNMNGEVVGIIRGGFKGLEAAEAVHVEELREILGLPIYDMPGKKYLPTIEPWSGAVYSTGYSRLFHQPDCNGLGSKDGGLITFTSKEDAIKNGGKPCPECNP